MYTLILVQNTGKAFQLLADAMKKKLRMFVQLHTALCEL